MVAELRQFADVIAIHLGASGATRLTSIAKKTKFTHKLKRLRKFHSSEIDDWVRRDSSNAQSEPFSLESVLCLLRPATDTLSMASPILTYWAIAEENAS